MAHVRVFFLDDGGQPEKRGERDGQDKARKVIEKCLDPILRKCRAEKENISEGDRGEDQRHDIVAGQQQSERYGSGHNIKEVGFPRLFIKRP